MEYVGVHQTDVGYLRDIYSYVGYLRDIYSCIVDYFVDCSIINVLHLDFFLYTPISDLCGFGFHNSYTRTKETIIYVKRTDTKIQHIIS